MNKTQYLEELRKYLKRVPKQDLDDALEYYIEYFEDAGEENEQKIIEELGSPKELAKRIIIECVDKNFNEETEVSVEGETKKNKKDLSVWLILAAVFALPLSPILFALLIVLVVLVFTLFVVLVALILSFGGVVLSGIFAFIVGVIAVFATSPTGGLLLMGLGLAFVGLGGILVALLYTLTELFVKALVKGGKKLVHSKKAGEKK